MRTLIIFTALLILPFVSACNNDTDHMDDHMGDMHNNSSQYMMDMNSMMNNQNLINNPDTRNQLEQMQNHMSVLMQNYENMLQSMNEVQENAREDSHNMHHRETF
ncbi:hypothetical protein GF406_27485 [candidate division KSB1 bacterium]|nr:hypothetical protein [candidate division KSB1 bacterium]